MNSTGDWLAPHAVAPAANSSLERTRKIKVLSPNRCSRDAQLHRQVSVMRYSRIFATALTILLVASFATADEPVASASFRELFGVGESQAIEVFGSDTARCLSDALIDFNLALAGENPVHSTNPPFPQLLDGGTALWEGACYKLTILKRLTTYRLPDGALINGWVVGPSLQLRLSPDAKHSEPISRTRFVFIQKREE